MNVQIITDSASDLPEDLVKKHQIKIMPLMVIIGEEEYYDREEIQAKELYKQLREGTMAKTSQIPPARIKETFMKYAEKGQPFIYIALSSGISGTYQSAAIIKNEVQEEFPNVQMEVIDSKAASLGYGLMAIHAAELAENGKSFEQISESLHSDYLTHMEHIFTVDDLEFLQRGGRVSKASAFFGGMLKIKPVLHVDDGKLIPIEKIRGKNKVTKRMVEIMQERGVNLQSQLIGITHGDDLESAKKLKSAIQETYGSERFVIHEVGATIGSHSGPGTLALFFLNK
ncbi:DegV family EDD domain-containing protein [Bacillus hwajinpoensis]|uniref:DegV family EDD domain-containing protein n=1 Tax=Guptibacillus hwajinpoensis TaxID=208199 RepID=A0A845F1V5_9BACL|nr:DegV family protein [Pseudalkalibacillus hwajinpoensis]MYL64738.1 DegV family EDD domain-containing protein [Pseudalkalibacillus hwajinpoensis]